MTRRLIRVQVCLLGSLLVFAFCGCGGPDMDPEGREVVDWVLKKGGTVTISGYPVPIKSEADLPEGEVAILGINLNERPISDKGLANLIGLKNLRTLGLHQGNITDKGIDHLVGIDTLAELELSYTRITDKGLEKLAAFPNLQKVYLSGTTVTKEGIESLKKALPNVTVFRL